MQKRKKLLSSAVIAIFLIAVLIWILSDGAGKFLSETHRTKANVLVVEGWLPQYAIDSAFREAFTNNYDYVVTTAVYTKDLDYFNLFMNGYLIFYPGFPETETSNEKLPHHIEIIARSKKSGNYCSHFNFFINDSLAGDFTADSEERRFSVKWNGSLNEIDSFMVHFDNDYVDEEGDRNLYVKELVIDSQIVVPFKFHTIYDMGKPGGSDRLRNDYISISDIARNTLISKGIDSSKVISLTAKNTRFNRTLASVIAFRKWLKSSDIDISGINVVSLGTHSRRTWIAYKQILGKKYNIGILSFPDTKGSLSGLAGTAAIVTELLDLVYYRIILIFY